MFGESEKGNTTFDIGFTNAAIRRFSKGTLTDTAFGDQNLATSCPYCQMDTGMNHAYDCPNNLHKIVHVYE